MNMMMGENDWVGEIAQSKLQDASKARSGCSKLPYCYATLFRDRDGVCQNCGFGEQCANSIHYKSYESINIKSEQTEVDKYDRNNNSRKSKK